MRSPVNRRFNSLKIKASVGQKIHLAIAYAIFAKASGKVPVLPAFLPYPNHPLKCIIRFPDRREKLILRSKIGRECHSKRVGTAGKLRAHECSLRVKYIRIDCLECFAPGIVVAVPGRSLKMCLTDPVFLHRL